MSYLQDALQYQKDAEEFINRISENLSLITGELIELLQNKSIYMFGFRGNVKQEFYGNAHPITITVDIKEKIGNSPQERRNNTIILGYMDDFESLKLNETAKATLININEYLSTLNEHFVKQLPAIDITTFCSLKTLRDGPLVDGDFTIPLYPEEFSPLNISSPEQVATKKRKKV